MVKYKYTAVSTAALGVLLMMTNIQASANDKEERNQLLNAALTEETVEQPATNEVAKTLLNDNKTAEDEVPETQAPTTPKDDSKDDEAEQEVIYTVATIKSGAALYLPNNTKKSVASIKKATSSFSVKKAKNNAFYEVKIGNTTYWVKKEGLVEAKKQSKNINKTLVTVFNTKATYKVYSKGTKSSALLMTGSKAQTWNSVDVIKGYYVVAIGGQKGYIPFSSVNAVVKANTKVQLVASTNLYEVVNGKKKALGTLSKGAVIKTAAVTTSDVKFKRGNRTFVISKSALIPTTKAESFGALKTAAFPVALTSETTATVYTSKGNKVGTLKKGQGVKLVALSGEYGIINFAGRNGYVNLSQFKHTNMVDPSKNISPAKYSYYVKVINKLYPEFTKLEKIGESVEGRPLYALQVGTGKKEILVDAGIHAREHMTTNVVMEMIDQYTVSYRSKTKFSGYNTKAVLDKTSIWFIPMINPDGVTLVQKGLKAMTPKNQKIIKAYNRSSYYKRWKANGRGVDLNRNFDGVWSLLGNTSKSFMGYKGPTAFSEPESKAVKSFVEAHKFKADYSYHSSGQVLYWYNFQNKKNYARDLNLTRKVSRITGYSVIAPLNNRASGSSADWFILSQKQPGLTIEIAPYSGLGPVPHKYFNSIWAKNKTIGLFGAKEASNR